MKKNSKHELYLVLLQDIKKILFMEKYTPLYGRKTIGLAFLNKVFEPFLNKYTRNKDIKEINFTLEVVNGFFRTDRAQKIEAIEKKITYEDRRFIKRFEYDVQLEDIIIYEKELKDVIHLAILAELKEQLVQEKESLEKVNQLRNFLLVSKNFYRDFLSFIDDKIFDNNKKPQSSYEAMPNYIRQKIFEELMIGNCQRIKEKFQKTRKILSR